jgi:hypothetical protein
MSKEYKYWSGLVGGLGMDILDSGKMGEQVELKQLNQILGVLACCRGVVLVGQL